MKKKTKAQKRKMFVASRRGVIVVALIAVLVLVINLITASYSWFTPQEEAKRGMEYSFDGQMRSENCTMTTYVGNKLISAEGDSLAEGQYWGQIVYGANGASGSQTVAAGKTLYVKTEIINGDTNNASDISLYISSLPACTLAVTYPGNSVRRYSSTQTDCYIVRDAFVKRKDNGDVNGLPGKLEIEWFVTNNGSSNISVNLNNLYLLYN